MKILIAGGWVRDTIMGRKSKDIDYVVVGSTPKEMLQNGFIQVGADFPVFLNNGDEYSLARTERKVGKGYHGFETNINNVTIEEDLFRRDLTINSIAYNQNTGEYIDPYGGIQDIKDRILRHTSDAFKDDPLRVLRCARFSARYPDFTIHEDTMDMMKGIVKRGELQHLSKERIWVEFKKAFSDHNPAQFIKVLYDCGALQDIIPEIGIDLSNTVYLDQFIYDMNSTRTVESRMAVLIWYLPIDVLDIIQKRMCIPNDVMAFCFKYHNFNKAAILYQHNTDVAPILVELFNTFKVRTDTMALESCIKMYQHASQYYDDNVVKCANNLVEDIWDTIGIFCDMTFATLPVTLQERLKGKAIQDALRYIQILHVQIMLSTK